MERTDGHERHDGHPHDGNRNGVIRRYLPKRSRIEPSMAADVQAIVDETNNRPMWVLGYRTPAEAFADELLELTDKQARRFMRYWRTLSEKKRMQSRCGI